jgi:hypothetical protein
VPLIPGQWNDPPPAPWPVTKGAANVSARPRVSAPSRMLPGPHDLATPHHPSVGGLAAAVLISTLTTAGCAGAPSSHDPRTATTGERDASAPAEADGMAGERGQADNAKGDTGDDNLGPPPDASGGRGGIGAPAPSVDAGASVDRGSTSEDAKKSDQDVRDGAATDGAFGFENSLGMRFLSLPGLAISVSIWETRVKDFDAYAAATGVAIPRPDFNEGPLQPKAAVSRAEAQGFAEWLTRKERSEGRIGASAVYRLPTDVEWDVAMAAGNPGRAYPWGDTFPPPDTFANYGVSKDGFEFTAPVGSFPANPFGLYDMAGNLWEWIGDPCDKGGSYLVRGGGFNARTASYFALGFHYCFARDLVGHHNVGFRLVFQEI